MPGHGDLTVLIMSRIALFSTLWVPTVYIHPDEVERLVRIEVAWRILALLE